MSPSCFSIDDDENDVIIMQYYILIESVIISKEVPLSFHVNGEMECILMSLDNDHLCLQSSLSSTMLLFMVGASHSGVMLPQSLSCDQPASLF